MQDNWIVNLRMAFEGSAALVGRGSIARGEVGSAVPVSGVPLGIDGLVQPDQFIEAAAEQGMQRLFLLCADGITENLERRGPGPIYEGDEFVLVGEPIGHWQLWHSGRTRLVLVEAEPPTSRQLDIGEATSRLERMLIECLGHPDPSYRKVVRRALDVLEGHSLPAAAHVQPFGVSDPAVRLYTAANQIGALHLMGNGSFTDMLPSCVPIVDLVYTLAQAFASSTRG
ncbi:MAG: hypothetical protein GY720_15015 [bacterium]|nr:hypothetical protein [bacterium]